MKKNILLISLIALLVLLSGCQARPSYVAPKTFHYTATSNVSGVNVYCGTSQYNLKPCYTTPYDERVYSSQHWSHKFFQGKKAGYKDSNIVQHPYQTNFQHAKVYFQMKQTSSTGYSTATSGSSARIVGIAQSNPSKIYHAGNMSLARAIVQNGEVKYKGMSGFTALHNASFTAPMEVIKYLLDNGADMEAKNILNQTPVYMAAKYAKADILKFLIRNGANMSVRDTSGKSILQATQSAKKLWETTLRSNPLADKEIQKYNEIIAILQNPPRVNKIEFISSSNADKEEKLAITKVKEIDTIKAYEKFLAEYPKSKYASTAKERIVSKRKALQIDIHRQKEILDKIVLYLDKKDIDGLLNYANGNDDVMAFAQNQPKIYLLFSGPKGLQVGKILQYKSKGLSDSILTSKIIANNKPYRNYSLDEISTMLELGLTDKLLSAMLDVTTAYEKENRQYKAQQDLIRSQERISKQRRQTVVQRPQTVYINQEPTNTSNTARQSTVGDKVMDTVMEKGIEMLIKNLF